MKIIYGLTALSPFRVQWLLSRLQAISAEISAVSTRFVYFADVESELTELHQQRLNQLIEADADQTAWVSLNTLFIIPRPGTISPWSSKASEIAERCGLNTVKRVERGIEYQLTLQGTLSDDQQSAINALLHDRMMQVVVDSLQAVEITHMFDEHEPQGLQTVPVVKQGKVALQAANTALGLALSDDEVDYLCDSFLALQRDPTDVELMMFAQANSEHCRHKIFNADWIIDDVKQAQSLFEMIKNTAEKNSAGILSAYSDNASVMKGPKANVFIRDAQSGEYGYIKEDAHILMKVETHNHPTAISPHPGAATGSGGEIRDEGATGRGSQTKAGLTGFSVSHLNIPGFQQPWEINTGKPGRISSALDIMLEGPIGGAAFNNEFGRPNLAGYFRTFEQTSETGKENHFRGYHKPIMLAGGMGNIRPMLVDKKPIPAGSLIIILGGPAMLIGLGGGAASSQTSGESAESLDFASVQRENPEMERRCQEVINHCNAMGEHTPVISIHDIGAGGLSNAVPEIIHDCARGGQFEVRDVNNADKGMSPMQIWCNEAQERYVVAIKPESLTLFESFCQREHCLYAVIGKATSEEHLTLTDEWLGGNPIDLPMSVLFGKPPKMLRDVKTLHKNLPALAMDGIDLEQAVSRVLAFPAVADKSFLIHIGDRSVTGLVVRDQLVGPWQVPVADVAVTASGFQSLTGEAMAMGERAPLALINAPASGRMAIGEAITNIAASSIKSIKNIKLSANWMAAAGSEGEDADLFATVKAVGMALCPQLGIAIPVGKDSLSMKTVWKQDNIDKTMTAPLSLIITAFAPVKDISKTLTPQLQDKDSVVVLIDLGEGKNRLGGSVLAQVYQQLGNECPDVDNAGLLKKFFLAIQRLNSDGHLLAYHDRSDGGLFATLAEMIFAGRKGIDADLSSLSGTSLEILFNEELGAVIQVAEEDQAAVMAHLENAGLGHCSHVLGQVTHRPRLTLNANGQTIYQAERSVMQLVWSELSYKMQALRDNPECAQQQYDQIKDSTDPGLTSDLSFDVNENPVAHIRTRKKPRVAILREQGVNGHVEMAAAFDRAGFKAIDVHITDILQGRVSLQDFVGLAACGGFSYGDVLGAGGGWAKSILYHAKARQEFSAFFARSDTFGLGVCNGCQMMSGLRDIIPGADNWPKFKRNLSEQFEARVAMVKVERSPSILFKDMEGSMMPVVIAHGEGRVEFDSLPKGVKVTISYVNNYGVMTNDFPANPNGSPLGMTGLTTQDGRFTIMMPHPERCFRTLQNSWHPEDWGEDGPWMRMFRNARLWVENSK